MDSDLGVSMVVGIFNWWWLVGGECGGMMIVHSCRCVLCGDV